MKKGLWAIGILLLFGCAQQVAPTGGPKDETPPKILAEKPNNLSARFDAKEIVLTFDEFIQLNAPAEQIVISPPMLKPPLYVLRKKSLVIKLQQELSPNTTYTINFGEAIKDNNEGNVLSNYTYVFSTGDQLDSMRVQGKLIDALTGSPEPDALVMLYKNDVDSLPLTTIPDYFTRTGKDGTYAIDHVADQAFKIFALKDENANYLFDVPTEKIGFIDSLIVPYNPKTPASDDSLKLDTVVTDSLQAIRKTNSKPIASYDMVMFVEEDTTQFLKKAYCDYFGKLVFVYNRPIESFDISLSNVTFKKQWHLLDVAPTLDTVVVWVTDLIPDSMELLVAVQNGVPDTVGLVMKPYSQTLNSSVKVKGQKRREEKFALTANFQPVKSKAPKPNEPLKVIWNHPIIGMDISTMKLYEDSVRVIYDITTSDPALRRFDISYPWKKGKKYNLIVADSAFTDVYGLYNDSLGNGFTGMDKDMYGSLSLKLESPPKNPILVELINSSQALVERWATKIQESIKFSRLDPGTYDLLIVEDLNNNGRWDSGKYIRNQQPEYIKVIEKGSEVRANWDLELEWNPTELH
ncbi:MAG: hypothetical protein RL266_892 [Bacteroidota bacterium]